MGLEAYKGRNRVLLVFAPFAESTAHVEQRRLFDEANAGLADRDLLVFYLSADETDDNATALRKQFSVDKNAFTVVLVGKDGGEKERFANPRSSVNFSASSIRCR